MPSAHRPHDAAARVVVFGRHGCHLCADVEAVVDQVCAELGVGWRTVSIDDDASLHAAYAELIPVVHVDGVQVAHWHLTPDTLRRALTT